MRAAIYVRISTDREDETSTTTQEQRCREYAVSRGWTVADVYMDKGRSAFKTNGKRPALTRLMADVEAGLINVVVVWKLDRWSRSATDWYRLWDRLQRAGCGWASVTDSFDTTTAMGEAMVGVAVVFARLESAIKSERITEWHHYRSASGKPPTGRPAFGYRKNDQGQLEIHKAEAKLISAAVDQLLDGGSVRSIIRSWNSAGITTQNKKPWSNAAFRKVMHSPTLIGCRSLDGVLVPGGWEPIVDRKKWQQVDDLLADPNRRMNGGDMTPRMLTGILLCGKCGNRMGMKSHPKGPRYGCRNPYFENDSCGKVSILAKLANDYVAEAVAVRVGSGLPNVETFDPDEIARLEAELSALAGDYGAGAITRAEWQAARAGLEARLEEAVAKASRSKASIPTNLAEVWPKLTVEARRAVILTLIESVTAAPGYNKTDRLSITWRP